jgi:glycosyltransferase involved in cell wall biosynthesis
MRIAIVTDTYTPQVNGVTTVLRRIVSLLRAAGHEATVVAPRYPNHATGRDELRLRSMPCPRYPAVRLTWPRLRRLSPFLDERRPDLVHVPTEGPIGLMGRAYALRRGLPLVTAFHTNFPNYAGHYGWPRLESLVWRWLVWFHRPAQLTFAPGTAACDALHRRGIHAATVWGCAVDTAAFHPLRRSLVWRRALGVPDETPIVLHVGRLAPEKNLGVLVDAWERLHQRFGARLAFVIAGEGPAERTVAHRMPWAHRIGFLDRDALAQVYASTEICTLPSTTETCGLVALEAMASGLAVVAADAGGFRDTISDGESGLLVPGDDPDAFLTAVTTLVQRPDRRHALGLEARRAALGRDLDTANSIFLEQIVEVAGHRIGDSACTAA